MSLVQQLSKPVAIGPTGDHSHTVVFLHRFPAETTRQELGYKVLAKKKVSVSTTLQNQYPTIRWVFPFPKLHLIKQRSRASHWENLSPSDITELELEDKGIPYITQIIIREAHMVGGLDKIIVGGQGEAAIAAHAAVNRIPEIPSGVRNKPEDLRNFIQRTFPGSWTDISQFKLAGFVGMHGVNDGSTPDQRTYLLVSRFWNKGSVRDNIVVNTPHKFIHGGIKKPDDRNDGIRILEFAEFLESIGVPTIGNIASRLKAHEPRIVGPRFTKADEPIVAEQADAKIQHKLKAREKHRRQIVQQKQQQAQDRERVLKRIGDDKIERKARSARERHDVSTRDNTQHRSIEQISEDHVRRPSEEGHGHVLGGTLAESGETAAHMTESRLKAFGVEK
ncbi:hypothetical protein SCAR479_11529 [Seiridium cardinale]|uniref:Uncharacterized protein n=1 Tax=Seiridium cardinale TaxID=138064 RepID=A0ABR2XDD4_9PEZI